LRIASTVESGVIARAERSLRAVQQRERGSLIVAGKAPTGDRVIEPWLRAVAAIQCADLPLDGRGVRGVREPRQRLGSADATASRSQGGEIPAHDRRPRLGRPLQRGSGSSPPSASR